MFNLVTNCYVPTAVNLEQLSISDYITHPVPSSVAISEVAYIHQDIFSSTSNRIGHIPLLTY